MFLAYYTENKQTNKTQQQKQTNFLWISQINENEKVLSDYFIKKFIRS